MALTQGCKVVLQKVHCKTDKKVRSRRRKGVKGARDGGQGMQGKGRKGIGGKERVLKDSLREG